MVSLVTTVREPNLAGAHNFSSSRAIPPLIATHGEIDADTGQSIGLVWVYSSLSTSDLTGKITCPPIGIIQNEKFPLYLSNL